MVDMGESMAFILIGRQRPANQPMRNPRGEASTEGIRRRWVVVSYWLLGTNLVACGARLDVEGGVALGPGHGQLAPASGERNGAGLHQNGLRSPTQNRNQNKTKKKKQCPFERTRD